MRLSLVLAGLSWLLNPVGSVPASMTPTDEQQEMIIFGSDRSQPVWFAQTEIIGEITMAQLYTLANAHFNWVRTQDGAETKAGSLLVAALWVPSVHTVFASTIPRGSFSRFMKQSTNIAPVWWSRASHFIGPNNADDAYHAEDGAYFNFEARTRTYRSLEGTNPDNLGNQVYPPGTMVAVWGYYPSDSVDKKRTGRPIDLCDATRTSKPRDPSCQQMAKSLGVGFEIVTDQTPDEQTADDNEDFMMDMSDSDFDQACALLDQPRRIPRGGIKHVRQATACSSRLTEVATYAPTPLTIDLNGLPPPPSTTAPTLTNQQPSTITAGPTLSCELHNQDPDQGILKPYCLCEKSITLSPLPATKAQSDSCAYSTIPGTSASVVATTQTQVWTTNCQACTIVGGIADQETCTSVPGCKPTATPLPTIAAWISNSSTIDIGNAEDGNDGVDLAKEMFNKLKDMCDDTSCKSDLAVMDNVEAILGDGEQPLKPAMYLQDATFSSPAILDQMLSVGISSWVAALNNKDLGLCKEVEYEADAEDTGVGCGKGPISPSRLRRKIRRDNGALIWERSGLAPTESRLEERCLDNCDHPVICHYTARMCSAPNEITVVMAGPGNPYANRLNIGVQLEHTSDSFMCEEITAALTAFVVFLAPELLGPDVMADVELEAICGFIEDPASIIGSLTNTVKVAPHVNKLKASGLF